VLLKAISPCTTVRTEACEAVRSVIDNDVYFTLATSNSRIDKYRTVVE